MDEGCGDCGHFVAGADFVAERDCRRCWLRHHEPYFREKYGYVAQAKDWQPPGGKTQVNGKPDLSRFRLGICPHQGAKIAQIGCGACGQRDKVIDVMACKLHGRCTQEFVAADKGIAYCQVCDDHPEQAARKAAIAERRAGKRNSRAADAMRRAREQGPVNVVTRANTPPAQTIMAQEQVLPLDGTISVNMAAFGIGDGLLGMTAVGGLKQANPGRKIVYKAPGASHQWVTLFDGGYDQLDHHSPPSGDEPVNPVPGDLQANRGYYFHRDDTDGPRWERYCRNIGAPGPVLPTIRDRGRLLSLGTGWAGAVVLAPFSIYPPRQWKIECWFELIDLLKRMRYPVVAIHSCDDFHYLPCEHRYGMPADQVAGMMLNSAGVIGVDSGMTHFAGALGVPALALCGTIPGRNVFGVWPSIRPLDFALSDCSQVNEVARIFREMVDPACVHGFHVHAGRLKHDATVIDEVYVNDIYQARELARRERLRRVLDVGAHIGCFSRFWGELVPGAEIFAVEVCRENIEILRRNLAGKATVVHAACLGEGMGDLELLNCFTDVNHATATGGSIVIPASAELPDHADRSHDRRYRREPLTCERLTLRQIMRLQGWDGIDLLKLDCEGSEYGILAGAPIQAIRYIVGEYHGRERWNAFRPRLFAGWEYRELKAGEFGIFHLRNPDYRPLEILL